MTLEVAMAAGVGNWYLGVVIPARDEAECIEACIAAVRASIANCHQVQSSWIVVVADCCSDATASLARTALGSAGEAIECRMKSAGAARRLGVERLLRHWRAIDCRHAWIANTDGDSQPAPDWIHSQLTLADQGTVAVAGVVTVRSVPDVKTEHLSHLMTDYRVNADGSHSHVHGANLGVRADAYSIVGGWKDLALSEDHCLWTRLKTHGWPIVASVASTVVTSGRLNGRVTGGFAEDMRRRVERLSIKTSH